MIEPMKKDTTKHVVSLTDIFAAIKKAKQENNVEMTKKLMSYFTSAKTEDKIIFNSNDEVYKFIKPEVNEISLESIMVSYCRALTDNNHEMKSKFKKILFEYIDNKKEGIDNAYLLDIIEDDKLLNKYSKEIPTIKVYKEVLEQKAIKKQEKSKNNIIQFPKQEKDNVYTFENISDKYKKQKGQAQIS